MPTPGALSLENRVVRLSRAPSTIGSLVSPYPLETITDAELQQLAQALWNWDILEMLCNWKVITL
ncbi:hypothetical protein BKA56DRAFT_601862 [Ilyonectria sp. MPI-CAGE-AT-0026]|nr:hypothetical protein BKA56DRAFT_604063 [Ilyonectria sp. MPI-CAGE-AT-0026]KAH6957542.1 hypothetical protein BKA56DRAFT_601862 [Ilyonectria sp. MPI-CAGE-AT-0026]